ncbi:hypothetical protein THAOC_36275 [Thalassiosira oceanica]|uniref:Peroxin-14 n=2 Tax=Thalassiosira oceanica TaxID=159749 RepID=K0R8L9_THAOC|nr:hypothetical protein THAOC_36275 [Thalassiosira oceanica]|eukprot:EJK45126.1 hypothetical protein THAOC_36275 [Thalassiosira oceanica]
MEGVPTHLVHEPDADDGPHPTKDGEPNSTVEQNPAAATESPAGESLPRPRSRERLRDGHGIDDKMDKAVAFLRNSEIRDVPEDQKRRYLQSKAGMTSREIDSALNLAADREGLSRDDRRRDEDHRLSRPRYQEQQLPYQPRRNEVGPGQIDYQQPSYDGGYSGYSQQNYQQSNSQSQPPAEGASGVLPAWLGGLSMGVFCLAALRWLNGGDFILFPPATANDQPVILDEPTSMTQDNKLDEEGEDIEGADGDDEECTEDEEYQEDIDGLEEILAGGGAREHHPQDDGPSYEELVLEIRTLTSSVNSLRDEQQRANRAATAQAGKEVTDDVMDVLRQKRTEEESSNTTPDEVMLSELSDDLAQLKKIILAGENEKSDVDGNDDTNKPNEDDQRLSSAVDQLQLIIDKVEKIAATANERKKGKTEKVKNINIGETQAATAAASSEAASTGTTERPLAGDEGNASTGEENEQALAETDAAQRNEQLESAIRTLSTNNSPDVLKVGAQMLYLYCLNISKNPSIARYRKIFTNNSTFRNKVGSLDGARELLVAVGFDERTNCYEWTSTDNSQADTKSRLDFALTALGMMKSGGGSSQSAGDSEVED